MRELDAVGFQAGSSSHLMHGLSHVDKRVPDSIPVIILA